MSKFKTGDKVTVHYPTYVENATVIQVHEINSTTTDYTVAFGETEFGALDTDIVSEEELTANPNN